MLRLLSFNLVLTLVLCIGSAHAQSPRPEPADAADHPLVGRYEGSRIRAYKQTAFDEVRVITGAVKKRAELDAGNTVVVAGRQTVIAYEGPEGRSSLEVMQNFLQGMASRGFELVFSCHRETCGDKNGTELWFALIDGRPLRSSMMAGWQTGRYAAFRLRRAQGAQSPQGDIYAMIYVQELGPQGRVARVQTRVEVVEARAMETDKISVIGASELQSSLQANGRVALYGIYFEVDAADVKPASAPQIDAIVDYLRANAQVGIVVTGHTDAQGAFDYNVALSQRRAQAVARALAAQGIAASRITAFGAGMAAPVASNSTPEGQGRNRRVEIVRR